MQRGTEARESALTGDARSAGIESKWETSSSEKYLIHKNDGSNVWKKSPEVKKIAFGQWFCKISNEKCMLKRPKGLHSKRRSLPLPLRLPLVSKCLHAFLLVFRSEEQIEVLPLKLKSTLNGRVEGLEHSFLGEPDRNRRL